MAITSPMPAEQLAAVVRIMDRPDLDDLRLLVASQGPVTIRRAPFDHRPMQARLVCVGITPGRSQAQAALQAFHGALRRGEPLPVALRHAKLVASFGGAMRGSLVAMLDHVGVHRALGVESCAALFDPARELVHFTSALRDPVFVNGANYNGTPDMLRTPLLRAVVEDTLAGEARALPDALWLPLGPRPAAALRHLVALGVLPAGQILAGLPHPSGANGERVAFFLGRKAREALSPKTLPDPIELARESLRSQVATLHARGA